MGYLKHHAIVVTCWRAEDLKAARAKALELGMHASEIVEGRANGQVSFFIAPDGSKEGWEPSDRGNVERESWIAWMRAQPSNYCQWAELVVGGDDRHAYIVSSGHYDEEESPHAP